MSTYKRKNLADEYPKYSFVYKTEKNGNTEKVKYKGFIIKTIICTVITLACFFVKNYETKLTKDFNDKMQYLLSYNTDYKVVFKNVSEGFNKISAIFILPKEDETNSTSIPQGNEINIETIPVNLDENSFAENSDEISDKEEEASVINN